VDKDLYELPPEEAAAIPQAPTSLEASLAALQADSDFLTEGDVFTEDLIEAYVKLKYDNEISPARLRPTPLEFEMYYDC
jgi:glutamine synthetase